MKKFEKRLITDFKNGTPAIALDHFLAMFPSTVLVPILINSQFGANVIDISLVLFASAIGTLLFLAITKFTLPAYLGSSFAYIGLTVYLISDYLNKGVDISSAYKYILWSYFFAAIIMAVLSIIYKYNVSKKIMQFLFPSAIMGPVVSLIGLELAEVAAKDSGFTNGSSAYYPPIAIATLFVIIVATVTRRKFLKNSSIVIGVIIGYILSAYFLKIDLSAISREPIIKLPSMTFMFFSFPPNAFQLFLAVLPATIVIFMENISRVTVINSVKYAENEGADVFNKKNNESFLYSLRGHAASIFASSMIGSVPTTIYAENIAVMNINHNDSNIKHKSFKPFSTAPYVIAAFFSMAASFFGGLQYLLMNIPKPVIGGIELFLFGIIAAPGIQMLVEQRVNYKKISNQILTASVLIAGVGGFSINLNLIQIKGMSLGLLIGIMLNILFKALNFLGVLNEQLSFDEVIQCCFYNDSAYKHKIVKCDTKVEIANDLNQVFAIVEKKEINTYLRLNLSKETIKFWWDIYDDIMEIDKADEDSKDWLIINIDPKIPNRHLYSIIDSAFEQSKSKSIV